MKTIIQSKKLKEVEEFKNAKKYIKKSIIIEAAKHLVITHKKGAVKEKDPRMIMYSKNRFSSKIIEIDEIDTKESYYDVLRKSHKMAEEIYTNNELGYTLVYNTDTHMIYEIGKMGIDKTFSKNVPIEKIPTAGKLKEIGEQGIYYITTFNPNDNSGIKYHHFLTPVKLSQKKYNAFIRTVIKEYTKDPAKQNKFYYHQIEYIENIKKRLSIRAI